MVSQLAACSINEEKAICYQLELPTECSSCPSGQKVMMTGAFSRNVGKLFSQLKLITDNLLFI